MTDAKQTSVVDYAIEALRNGIRDQVFVPGQRLVIGDVCRELGVSAGPVREAIRRLTGEGLIDFEPNKGASVKRFDPKDIREIFDVRVAIEARAAELAAKRIDKGENRHRLLNLLKEGDAAVAVGGLTYIDHNASFHQLIYKIAANDRLAETAEALTLPLYRMQFHQLIVRTASENSHREHLVIANAILSNDAEAARAAMHRHVEGSGAIMAKSLEDRHAARERRR